jgi:hypothetical protein
MSCGRLFMNGSMGPEYEMPKVRHGQEKLQAKGTL